MRLDLPKIKYYKFIDEVVAERQSGINATYFNGIKSDWKTRIKEYQDNKGNPEIIKPWPKVTPDKKKSFLNLYNNPHKDSAQRIILENLRSRTLQLCPACGEAGTPNTLDHYLPKESYPEFSITAANLSPMCDICQGEKKAKTVNDTNERLFLHPYFDAFTDKQVVALKLGRPFKAPTTITLIPHPRLNSAQSSLILRHIEQLNIERRYHRFFREKYLCLLKHTTTIRQRDQDVKVMLTNFCNMAYLGSVNSWEHVFYDGVLADKELVTYLQTGNLPAFL
ncbi:hypothetical protein KFZ76_22460 [Methylovulum psychrotolerans]|uniref:hypothetical protein n=1 Tax=Methylovulum psychrotolerans TaxID=1704499 RepID=UPI001BFF8720|nr:hypothetical protein [Methylovulum psychrotolerans]MBT9100465.1 hypothetical protein [Methylovulum psychrotolerans]